MIGWLVRAKGSDSMPSVFTDASDVADHLERICDTYSEFYVSRCVVNACAKDSCSDPSEERLFGRLDFDFYDIEGIGQGLVDAEKFVRCFSSATREND